MTRPSLTLRVTRFAAEAKDVALLELQSLDGKMLPPFEPGAHVEVHLDNGNIRHYSLLNDPAEKNRYVIAVSLAQKSLGGSHYIHTAVRQGDLLQIGSPRNNFPLKKDSQRYYFIAGGIGITPILSMIRWCIANGKTWRLVYTARNRQRAAFYETLLEFDEKNLFFHFNDEQADQFIDIHSLVDGIREDEQVYCCGPNPLMQAVKHATEGVLSNRIHFEWFSAPAESTTPSEAALERFSVTIKSTGHTFEVAPDQTILEALETQGIDTPFSCRAGICATCETKVCHGVPDHRDYVLSEEDRASGKSMMICVSRSLSQSLTLDL
jgi:ferredoxin-NADP reductase